MIRAPLARGAALLGLLALAGCGLFSSSSSAPPQTCPSAVILRPLANTAVFGAGTEVRPDNVAFYGLLSEVDRKCDYAGDAVRISLDVIVVGQRGPAAKSDVVDLTYFVAVTGPNQTIISKKPFTVPRRIPGPNFELRSGPSPTISPRPAPACRQQGHRSQPTAGLSAIARGGRLLQAFPGPLKRIHRTVGRCRGRAGVTRSAGRADVGPPKRCDDGFLARVQQNRRHRRFDQCGAGDRPPRNERAEIPHRRRNPLVEPDVTLAAR